MSVVVAPAPAVMSLPPLPPAHPWKVQSRMASEITNVYGLDALTAHFPEEKEYYRTMILGSSPTGDMLTECAQLFLSGDDTCWRQLVTTYFTDTTLLRRFFAVLAEHGAENSVNYILTNLTTMAPSIIHSTQYRSWYRLPFSYRPLADVDDWVKNLGKLDVSVLDSLVQNYAQYGHLDQLVRLLHGVMKRSDIKDRLAGYAAHGAGLGKMSLSTIRTLLMRHVYGYPDYDDAVGSIDIRPGMDRERAAGHWHYYNYIKTIKEEYDVGLLDGGHVQEYLISTNATELTDRDRYTVIAASFRYRDGDLVNEWLRLDSYDDISAFIYHMFVAYGDDRLTDLVYPVVQYLHAMFQEDFDKLWPNEPRRRQYLQHYAWLLWRINNVIPSQLQRDIFGVEAAMKVASARRYMRDILESLPPGIVGGIVPASSLPRGPRRSSRLLSRRR